MLEDERSNLNIPYTEQDPIISRNPDIKTEELYEEIVKLGFEVDNWLNNFPSKFYSPDYIYSPLPEDTEVDKQYYLETEKLLLEIKETYNQNKYKNSFEDFKNDLDLYHREGRRFTKEMELILLEIYLQMINKGYSRYYNEGVSLIK